MLPNEVDIIVAGGGPAGCSSAGRIARADPNLQVMLIEAGANNYEGEALSLLPSLPIARRLDAYRGEVTSHHPHFHPGSPAACKDIDLVTAKQLLPNSLTAGIHMGTWSRPEEPHQVRKAVKEDIQYTEDDIEAIDNWISSHVETTFSSSSLFSWHSLGTCAMKPRENGGVVDAKMNVYGTQGLKIADLSICPENLGTNTYSSALLCGEKCAQIVADEFGLTIKTPHVLESARICGVKREITGKRTRQAVDGSKLIKVFLDQKDATNLEYKLDSFSGVYKKLIGKDVHFEFSEQ
ncbi:hypothetical protein JCM8547_004989 [Rhodosporidiobolus lusitaniae]